VLLIAVAYGLNVTVNEPVNTLKGGLLCVFEFPPKAQHEKFDAEKATLSVIIAAFAGIVTTSNAIIAVNTIQNLFIIKYPPIS